jgi:deazaflavin-dependent oxidoreductase (nitroreductase family)
MPTRRRMARFNRAFANHIFGPALTALPGFGMVYHRGRKSGREYRTPVKLFRRGRNYVITLPYGRDSDWVKNVLAAGGCELRTSGRRIRMVGPTLFVDDGRVAIPAFLRRVLSWLDCTDFLALTPAEPAAERP